MTTAAPRGHADIAVLLGVLGALTVGLQLVPGSMFRSPCSMFSGTPVVTGGGAVVWQVGVADCSRTRYLNSTLKYRKFPCAEVVTAHLHTGLILTSL